MRCIRNISGALIILLTVSCNPNYSKLLPAREKHNGDEWALSSRLVQALALAESKYGERDLSWTILGLEFYQKKHPQTWFPGVFEGRKQILIQLSKNSANDEKRALFEMAHEVIHCLSPRVGSDTASVLEEGLAVHFSFEYLQTAGFSIKPDEYLKDKKYKKAYDHVTKLYSSNPHADDAIKAARKNAGSFSKITALHLKEFFPGFDPAFYGFLAGNFSRSQIPSY